MTDYTPILHLPQVASNQEQKEATINTAIAILEAAMNDSLAVSLAAGDVTFNTDQFTKYFLFQFTGHTVERQVTIPATPRWFAIENQGTASVVIKVAGATGLTVELPALKIGLVVSDGADVRFVVPDPISGMGLLQDLSDVSGTPTNGQLLRYDAAAASWKPWTLTMAFTQLTDTPTSLSNNGGRLLAVNPAGTRIEFVSNAANVNSFVDLDDTPNSYTGAANRHLVVNAAGTGLTYATPYLRENSDFPKSYKDQAGKFVKVKAAEDGVEFGLPATGDLTDGPGAPVFGDALRYVRVNAAGTGWEYAPGTGGPVNFTELLDTPSSFVGHKGRLVRVNEDEDALHFSGLRLIELTDTPNAYAGFAGQVLRVNAAQSGMIFGALKVADLADGPGAMTNASKLHYLRVNANNTALEYVRPSITEMAGVPSMAGSGGRFVRVNGNEDGFEYAINPVDMAFLGLSDTPASYQSAQNKFVAVNAQGTGLIFVPAPSGGGGGGATALEQLTDVDLTEPPAAGEVLTFRDGVWGAEMPPPAGGGATQLEQLTDVSYISSPPQEDYVLTFKGGLWTPQPAVTAEIPQALGDLTDVDFSAGTPQDGDLLTFWNGVWIYAPQQALAGEGLRFGEHRDWRLFFRTTTEQALEIAELIMRVGAGLPQAAEGGTPAASVEVAPTWTAAMAFDGDPATFWRAPAASVDKSWLRYTFADPVEINTITLTPAALRQLPIAWDVQFSDDGGLTWITAWSESRAFGWGANESIDTAPTRAKLSFAQLSDSPGAMSAHAGKIVRVNEDGTKLEYAEFVTPAARLGELSDVNLVPTPTNGQVLTFKDGEWSAEDSTSAVPDLALGDLTDVETDGQQEGDLLGLRAGRWVPLTSPIDYGRHAYWRVAVDSTGASPGTTTVVVAEVALRDAPGGPQRAVGGTAIGTGGNINGAFDGTVGDAWTAYLPDAWIGYHFAAPIALQEVTLTASSVAGWATGYTPKAFRVQYSDDGVTWYTAWAVTGQTAWTPAQTRVYTRPGLTTRFLDHVDTPDTYLGQSGRLVHVKDDETGLEFVDKPDVPEVIGDLGDVDTTTAPPIDGQVLVFKPGLDLPSKWRPSRLYLDMMADVRIPVDLHDGQVLTWVDTGVEGSGYWAPRDPENGGGPGDDYPIYIWDGRMIESGEGAPDWAVPASSLYMRHDTGDLYASRATPRLAPRVVQEFGRVVQGNGAVTWGYDTDPVVGNWLILFYASGSNGPATLAPGWTVVSQGAGADLTVTVAYRQALASEDWPMAVATQSGPEDAYAVYEVSGLGDAWGDFFQAAQAAGATPGPFAPTAYTAPASSPYTFALAALFQNGGAAPAALNGEFFNAPLSSAAAGLSLSAATTYALEPDALMTVTGEVDAAAASWAYGAVYLDAANMYGEDLDAAWVRFLVEGEEGAKALIDLTDVDLTATPTNGQALVFRDGLWLAETVVTQAAVGDLTDVDFTSAPTNGQSLVYRNGVWSAETLVVSKALADLTDVDLTTAPLADQVLTFKGGKWKAAPAVSASMAALTDVDLTSPQSGQVVVYRAGRWVNESPQGAGVPSHGAHAWWRLLIDQTDGDASQVGIQDIWFRQTKTGPQLATGGTPTASSSVSGQGPAGAFDGVQGGAWFSAPGNPVGQWIAYAFVAPVEVRYLDLKGSQDYPTRSPRAFKVQWSDDGVAWTTAWTVTGQTGWAPNQTRQFHAPMDLFFTDLADAPPSYIGQGGKTVLVKADETGLEFRDVETPPPPPVPTHRGEFGLTSGYVTYDFEGTPSDRFAEAYAAGWATFGTLADPPYTRALKSPAIGNSAATSFTFTVDATPAEPDLTIRYRVSSETPDRFRVLVDGVVVLTIGGQQPYQTFTTPLAAGLRVITLQYVKDSSAAQGDDDVRISYIRCNGVYSAEPYLAGDTVTYDGVLYICLTPNTTQTPGDGADWSPLPAGLGDLNDVDLTAAPVQDHVLTYVNGVWVSKELPASAGGSVYMADIADVEMPVAGPNEGDALRYQDGKWRPIPAGTADNIRLKNATIGSDDGPPSELQPSGSYYTDEQSGQLYQSLKDAQIDAPAPTIVQHVVAAATTTGTAGQAALPIPVSLASAPTPGNWLVALLCDQTLATPGAGWTIIPGAPATSATRVRPSVAYKQVTSADGLVLEPFVKGTGAISAGVVAVYELAGVSSWNDAFRGVSWEDETTYTAASGLARAALTAAAMRNGTALGLYVVRPPEGSLTPAAPWTSLSAGSYPSSTGNRVYAVTSATVSAGGSVAPVATFTGASEAGYVAVLLDSGADLFTEAWRPYTGNIGLDDLKDVDATAPGDGEVLTYRDGVWAPEAAEGEYSGNGVPTAAAPLGKVYQRRDGPGGAWVVSLQSLEEAEVRSYTATGARQSFVVDELVTSLAVKMWGAGGGTAVYNAGGSNAAAGGYTEVVIPVSTGDLIELDVPTGGGGGHLSNAAGAGGWPDGGDGARGDTGPGGGGGSARVWKNGVLMAVAGGGGGGGGFQSAHAGAGGGAEGQSAATASGGTGGTQVAGGYDGNATTNAAKTGGYLQGGRGGDVPDRFVSTTDDGGGGGGGYYGGGGGGGDGQGGGGGSGYLNVAAGVVGVTEAGDRRVPPRQDDPDYVLDVGVAYPSVASSFGGPGPAGGPGLIVVKVAAYAPGWTRLTTTHDVAPLHVLDLLKVTHQVEDVDYVLSTDDRRAYRKITSINDRTLTVPPQSESAFPIGASFSVQRGGEGRLTILAGAGVTLEYPSDMMPRLRRQNSVASLVQIAPDVWSLFGDLDPV